MRVLSTFDVYHSRPIAPTRRVALGPIRVDLEQVPGFGGLLLAGVVAANIGALDEEMAADLHGLMDDVETGRRIKQPRLRHRFQVDRIGLTCSTHRLVGDGDGVEFDLADPAPPAPQVLAAVYEVGRAPRGTRRELMALLRRRVRVGRRTGARPGPVPHQPVRQRAAGRRAGR